MPALLFKARKKFWKENYLSFFKYFLFTTTPIEHSQFLLLQDNCFSNFSCMFLNPKNFSNMKSNCSNLLDMRNLHEQVKKAFCYQKLFWPFTVWINCSSDLKNFANSWPSASNFKNFSWSVEHFFLSVGQNNFVNKIHTIFF